MEVKVTPWTPDCKGYVCMPLVKNVPTPSNPEWAKTKCPVCDRDCWRSPLVDEIVKMGSVAVCTECAIRQGLSSSK